MKEIFRHIFSFIFAVLCALGMGACTSSSDTDQMDDGDAEASGRLLLVLHVNPIDAEASQPLAVTERIKSLRIIILGDGKIECNRLIESPEAVLSSQFWYTFTWATFSGKKEFYLIANEESVKNLQFVSEKELPDGLPDNLPGLLNRYKVDSQQTPDGTEFRQVMQSIYFTPDYTPDENGSLFLPYVSHYDDIEVKEGQHLGANLDLTMYLVPVATKFMFHFTNRRENAVLVDNITVSSVNQDNYLLAAVGSKDKFKDFDGLRCYWIDWLARVSKASHQTGGFYENENFNTLYGWISDYRMPNATKAPAVLVDSEQPVPGMKFGATKDEDVPGELYLGPFYLPESRNDITFTAGDKDNPTTVTEQVYYLTLGLQDPSAETPAPEFKDVAISNLKALFRNTSVNINVTMSQGEVAIYAEMADWTRKTANGWVVEGKP